MQLVNDFLYQKYKDWPLKDDHKWVLVKNDKEKWDTAICTKFGKVRCNLVLAWSMADYFQFSDSFQITSVPRRFIKEFIPPKSDFKQVNGGFKPGEMSVIVSGTKGKSDFAIEPNPTNINYVEYFREIPQRISFGIHLIDIDNFEIPQGFIKLTFKHNLVKYVNPRNIIALSNINNDEFYIYFKETSILYYHEDNGVLENIHKEIKQKVGF